MVSLNSAFGKLNLVDLVKGFMVAVFASFLTGLYDLLDKLIHGLVIQFTWAFFAPMVYVALFSGVGYLLKQLLTNSDGLPLVKDK